MFCYVMHYWKARSSVLLWNCAVLPKSRIRSQNKNFFQNFQQYELQTTHSCHFSFWDERLFDVEIRNSSLFYKRSNQFKDNCGKKEKCIVMDLWMNVEDWGKMWCVLNKFPSWIHLACIISIKITIIIVFGTPSHNQCDNFYIAFWYLTFYSVHLRYGPYLLFPI